MYSKNQKKYQFYNFLWIFFKLMQQTIIKKREIDFSLFLFYIIIENINLK